MYLAWWRWIQLQTCHLPPLLGDEQCHSHDFACGHQICGFPTFICLPLEVRQDMILVLKLNSFVPLPVKKKARVLFFISLKGCQTWTEFLRASVALPLCLLVTLTIFITTFDVQMWKARLGFVMTIC